MVDPWLGASSSIKVLEPMGRRGENLAMSDFISAVHRDKLTKACKKGRLFDALRMLEELGSARFRKTRKWTPLFVAVDRGFHSLVEVLLRYEHEAWDLEKAYGGALRRHRSDLAGLILRAPSWRAPIDPVEALATGDCDLIRAMIASGTDFTAPHVVARACLRSSWGTLECLTKGGIGIAPVQHELQIAMVTHASRGHIKSVVRLLRAGIDAHEPSDWFDERDRLMNEPMSAVHAAVYLDTPALLSIFRPSPEKDRAEDLLGGTREPAIYQVLLDAGFELNCQENGGSTALHDAITWGRFFSIAPGLNREREKFVTDVEWLLERGAKWVPRDSNDWRSVRDSLLAAGESLAGRLVKLLRDSGAITDNLLVELFRPPRMAKLAEALGGEIEILVSRKKKRRRRASGL